MHLHSCKGNLTRYCQSEPIAVPQTGDLQRGPLFATNGNALSRQLQQHRAVTAASVQLPSPVDCTSCISSGLYLLYLQWTVPPVSPVNCTSFKFVRPNFLLLPLFLRMCRPDPTKPLSQWGDLKSLDLGSSSEEMLDSLVTLDLALSCDGFVASFLSNWARLIQELRSTVRCKAHKVFLDVGTEMMHDNAVGSLDLNW